jgi:hypothetical protein
MFNILVKINDQNINIRKSMQNDNMYQILDKYNQKLSFTSPYIRIPFGLEKYKKDKMCLNLEFTNYKTNNTIHNFMATIKTIDTFFQDLKTINNIDLTTKKYISCFKERPDEYDPLLRTNIKITKRQMHIEIVSDFPNTVFDLENNQTIKTELEIDNLWIYDDKYGLNWIVKKIYF